MSRKSLFTQSTTNNQRNSKEYLFLSIDLIDPSASLDVAAIVAYYFDLDTAHAKNIFKEVGSATALWREEAAKLKIKKVEIDRMASAFEHEDLQKAL